MKLHCLMCVSFNPRPGRSCCIYSCKLFTASSGTQLKPAWTKWCNGFCESDTAGAPNCVLEDLMLASTGMFVCGRECVHCVCLQVLKQTCLPTLGLVKGLMEIALVCWVQQLPTSRATVTAVVTVVVADQPRKLTRQGLKR